MTMADTVPTLPAALTQGRKIAWAKSHPRYTTGSRTTFSARVTALRFGRCLLSSHVLLRSRFAHALRSLVSQRKRRAAAHNRVVLGSENLPSRGTVNQALGGAVATGVLGNPAIALCAVPLLIPVSALICAHERPPMPEEHNPERVHQGMLCRTLHYDTFVS